MVEISLVSIALTRWHTNGNTINHMAKKAVATETFTGCSYNHKPSHNVENHLAPQKALSRVEMKVEDSPTSN